MTPSRIRPWLLLSLSLLALALAACGVSSGGAATGTTAVPTPSATSGSIGSTPTPTQTATPSPIPTLDTIPDSWQTYHDTAYGFEIQVASYLTAHSPQSWNSGETVLIMVSDSVHGWEQVIAYVEPQPGAGECALFLSGDPVTIGSGINGYKRFVPFIAPPPGGGGGTTSPHTGVGFLASGTLMELELWGEPPAASYDTRYGLQLQHLLASFVAGPAYPGAHACQ